MARFRRTLEIARCVSLRDGVLSRVRFAPLQDGGGHAGAHGSLLPHYPEHRERPYLQARDHLGAIPAARGPGRRAARDRRGGLHPPQHGGAAHRHRRAAPAAALLGSPAPRAYRRAGRERTGWLSWTRPPRPPLVTPAPT